MKATFISFCCIDYSTTRTLESSLLSLGNVSFFVCVCVCVGVGGCLDCFVAFLEMRVERGGIVCVCAYCFFLVVFIITGTSTT